MEQARIPERYRLIEEVGQGGMAVVYRAEDESLKREVAIKVLHQHLAADPESRARLEREAQAVAKLRHPNILEIFDYSGFDSVSPYIVTEFIDGQTLKQFLNGRSIGFPEIAAMIVSEICAALAHAHGLGVLHRDVKPENVMIRKDGLLKLMDFGIAQIVDFQRLTVTGQLLGSPAYMAPEVVEGKRIDFRTDVFSAGIILYLLATGSLPFAGKNPHEVLRRISDGLYPDPRSVGRGVDQHLSRIIGRALARRPDDRYPDIAPLGEDLRRYLADAGLTQVRAELAAFFAAPPAYEAALPTRLASALTAAAEAQLVANRRAKALELLSRVLAFDPDNQAALAALRRIERRRRLRATLIGTAMVAGALGVVPVVVHHLRRPSAPPTIPTVASQSQIPPAEPMTLAPSPAEPVPPGPPGLPARPRGDARPLPSGARGGPPAAAPRVFTLGPTPQNVDVYLDGKRQFGYDLDHTTVSVPWDGTHVIELRSTSGCCFVEKVEVGPDRPLPPDAIIARRLRWRPAQLIVTTDPASAAARVLVRDPNRQVAASSARAGEEIDVPFFADDESSKEVEISVDADDAFTTETVRVRAGQRLKQTVKLKTGAN